MTSLGFDDNSLKIRDTQIFVGDAEIHHCKPAITLRWLAARCSDKIWNVLQRPFVERILDLIVEFQFMLALVFLMRVLSSQLQYKIR